MYGEEDKSRRRGVISGAGYNNLYSNTETNPHGFGPDVYNGMVHHHNHMVGFAQHQNGTVSLNRSTTFFDRPAAPDPTSTSNQDFSSYQHHDFGGAHILHEDDDVRSSCVFTCEGNERPSHGLSLSLNPANPSAIGLQSFELRQSQQQPGDYIRFGSSSFIRGSRYLGPTQELLSEFCNLGTGSRNGKDNKMKGVESWQESEDAIRMQTLYSLELIDLHRRKTKLLRMLEEVDRRYKHYCDQMRFVVSSFESVAGHGAATAYSALASKAMSRHFRSLKDGILCQINATRKAMGDKDGSGYGSAPGTVKGETPRLRVLDQTLRQQRALQQMGNMEISPWRPQRGLPERSVSVLRAWLFEHFLHPYPSDVDKHILSRQTGLSRSQVSNWFINARVRLWKPMVEEMYLEELKEDHHPPNDEALSVDESDDPTPNSDQKPSHDQLLRMESECFSSINNNNNNNMNNPNRNDVVVGMVNQNHAAAAFGGIGDHSFGGSAMEFDFSSYGNHSSGGGGVSLTLGLHQHGGEMSLPFSAAVDQGSMFSGGMDDNCEAAQYSLMDGEGGQNLPYRNLMGAQLLHDLAG